MRYLADFPNVAQFLPRIQHCIHNTQLFDDLFRIVPSPLRPYQDVSFTDLYRRDTPITAEPVFGRARLSKLDAHAGKGWFHVFPALSIQRYLTDCPLAEVFFDFDLNQ